MAVPSYTTDLIDWIADTDTTAWLELTNAAFGGVPDEADTESALQGTNTVSQATNTTSLFSMCRILASSVTLATNDVFLVWHGHGVATSLLSYASGGLRLAVATTLGDWKAWAVGGNDVPPFPYAKWVNNPVDPTITGEYTNGTPPAALTFFGVGSMGQLSLAVGKGQPHVVDIIRYGRAEARINGGETSNFAVFAGFAAANDATTARWGLIQATDGGYLWKGLMTLGYTSAVDFRDTNKTIFIQDTRKVYSSFNKVEIRQATSRVDWTGVTFTCLSPTTTASKGAFEMIDAADVNIESCNFIDMDTFIFLSSATINGSVFRRTGQITTGGATLTGCTIDRNTASSAVLASSPANAALISATDFTSDGTGHAIEITGTAADFTLTNNTYTGYAASDGTTGNEAVYVNIATGSMIISISGGSTPSIRTAGVTVIVQNAVTVKVTAKDATTLAAIDAARVLIEANSVATGTHTGANGASTLTDSSKSFTTNELVNYRIYNTTDGSDGLITANDATTVTATLSGGTDNDWDTSDAYIIVAKPALNPVSITRSGTTATATHRNHGLANGATVAIRGATQDEYNGTYTISNVSANAYDYTVSGSPTTPATGSPTSAAVILNDVTNASGVLQTTAFNYTINQPVTGKVRRATSGTKYKTGAIDGTITSAGLDTAILLIADE